MKKYLYILSIAALGLSSCASDYLDTKPEAQMDKASVMSTTEKAELAGYVIAVYVYTGSERRGNHP